MNKIIDAIIPYVGVKFNLSPVAHFFRDLLLTYIFWEIGFRDFQAAFATMLASGFFETGNGITFESDGSHAYFDFLDFLPSVPAGALMVSYFNQRFESELLLNLFVIYLATVIILILLNKLLGRKISIEK